MPRFVEDALDEAGLMELYRERPPYQQNDYVGWIARAKRLLEHGPEKPFDYFDRFAQERASRGKTLAQIEKELAERR